jgi:hypothetical protein
MMGLKKAFTNQGDATCLNPWLDRDSTHFVVGRDKMSLIVFTDLRGQATFSCTHNAGSRTVVR